MIPTYLQRTVVTGDSLTTEIDTQGAGFLGLALPASIGSATVITFLASSIQGAGWQPLSDGAGAELSLTVAAAFAVTPTSAQLAVLAPWRYLKIRFGTNASPDIHTADRVIDIVLKSPS